MLLNSSSVATAPLSFMSATSLSQALLLIRRVEKLFGPWHLVQTAMTVAFPGPSGKSSIVLADEAKAPGATGFVGLGAGTAEEFSLGLNPACCGSEIAKAMTASEFLSAVLAIMRKRFVPPAATTTYCLP